MGVIGLDHRQTCLAPRVVPSDEIRDAGEPEPNEVGGSERRAVATVADDDDRSARTRRRSALPTVPRWITQFHQTVVS
ncbi:MAG: hypothetical protein RI958_1679 [Actinomycetota bacterium]